MKRYAIVRNARTRREAEAYLPSNYRIIHESADEPSFSGRERSLFVIEGEDDAGWTLDSYVIPRYASGLIGCEEIDLSHPIMKQIERPAVTKLEKAAEAALEPKPVVWGPGDPDYDETATMRRPDEDAS
jgi:hypothetical protein